MQPNQVFSLSSLNPQVTTEDLLAQLVPPREFAGSSFANYVPDRRFESQLAARDASDLFATKPSKFAKKHGAANLYLDGGFGVGKTHLLASIFHAASGRKAFGSFLAYTGLIGVLGFANCLEVLSKYDLICIDEFELDDPGDTMMLSRLLSELDAKGVRFAATSNTPPNALGKGRFAAEDFAREISAMANRFCMLSIEGEDYRHRAVDTDSIVRSDAELFDWRQVQLDAGRRVAADDFSNLLSHLATLHPSRYAALVVEVDALALENVYQLQDQVAALRWVACVDRLYEAQVQIANSGVALTQVFSEEMIGGTYRKKYLRAVSRLGSLTTNH